MNVIYYADPTEVDQGGTGKRTIKSLIDAIGATKNATIVLAHNSNSTNTTYTVSTSVTITSNIRLKIEHGALVSIATTKTLTINGPFEAGQYTVFSWSGTGKVVFGSSALTHINAAWFGWSEGASAANNTLYFAKAVDSMVAYHTLVTPSGTYNVTNLVFDAPSYSNWDNYGLLVGDSTGAAVHIGNTTGTDHKDYYRISGLRVKRSTITTTTTNIGIKIRNCLSAKVDINYIWNYGTGLQLNGDGYDCDYNQFTIGGIYDCLYSIWLKPTDTGGVVNENTFYGGALSWSGSQDLTGHCHINITSNPTTAAAAADSNRFYGQALEDSASTGGAAIGVYNNGGYNYFMELRPEMNSGEKIVYHDTLSTDSVVFFGCFVNSMSQITDLGVRNKLFGTSEMWLNGNVDTAGHGVLNLYNTGNDAYKALSVWDSTGATNNFSVTSAGRVTAAENYYRGSDKVVGARQTGFQTYAGTARKNASIIDADTVTASDANIRLVAQTVKALFDALLAHGLIGP